MRERLVIDEAKLIRRSLGLSAFLVLLRDVLMSKIRLAEPRAVMAQHPQCVLRGGAAGPAYSRLNWRPVSLRHTLYRATAETDRRGWANSYWRRAGMKVIWTHSRGWGEETNVAPR